MHFWKKENQILMLISASLLQNEEEFNLKIQCSLLMSSRTNVKRSIFFRLLRHYVSRKDNN